MPRAPTASSTRGWLTVALALALASSPGCAEERFPDPIPPGEVSARIVPVATVPDSSSGEPPRLSVLTRSPDGRLFVNDQRGPLYVLDASGGATAYLDLRDYPELAVVSTSEAGFQSFAFHPGFATPGAPGYGRFYTLHSCSVPGRPADFDPDPGATAAFYTLLLEWRVKDASARTFVPADPRVPFRELLRLKQPFGNHNGGLVAFNPTAGPGGADFGNLYVAIGDGGSAGDPHRNGQNPGTPYGALLRIDPLGHDSANRRYGIVQGNVLAADRDPRTLGEIYAYGLRNPQRYGWDAATGRMFIADIGQNAVEEVDLGQNGANYGWNEREGSFPYQPRGGGGLTDPVAEYGHTSLVADPPTSIGSRAITLGEVVRGSGIAGLDGRLMLGDLPTGLVFTLNVDTDPLDGGQDGLSELRLLTDAGEPTRLLALVNAARRRRGLPDVSRVDLRFGVNTPGEVYVLDKHDGIVRRLAPPPASRPGAPG